MWEWRCSPAEYKCPEASRGVGLLGASFALPVTHYSTRENLKNADSRPSMHDRAALGGELGACPRSASRPQHRPGLSILTPPRQRQGDNPARGSPTVGNQTSTLHWYSHYQMSPFRPNKFLPLLNKIPSPASLLLELSSKAMVG